MPGQGLLHLRLVRAGRGLLPEVRPHREREHPQARDRGLPRAGVARDDRRVGDGAGRTVHVGAVLQGGGESAEQLLRRDRQGMAVLPGQVLQRQRTHPTILELQLRTRWGGARLRRAEEPGDGVQRHAGGVQDGAVVLDDGAEAQALLPRSHGREVPALQGRPRSQPDGRVRAPHQHNQRRPRVRHPGRPEGQRPDRLLPDIRQAVRGRHGPQFGLPKSEALLVHETKYKKDGKDDEDYVVWNHDVCVLNKTLQSGPCRDKMVNSKRIGLDWKLTQLASLFWS